ncbi:MAG: carboxypeptidase M32 [Candidatus Aenigmarchaeota archaeon]|nr:carboxypeptidase M32 [Candidatus Aenigmarchaeota archaeon]
MASSKSYKEFEKLMKEIVILNGIGGKIMWDQETYMPKAGMETASEQMALIDSQVHKIITSRKMGRLIEELEREYKNLDEYQRANLREMKWRRERDIKVPPKLIKEMSKASVKGYEVWKKAKKRSDFSYFEPQLKKIIDLDIKYAKYIDPDRNSYEVLIEDYEPFIGIREIKKIFADLGRGIVPLLKKIEESDVDFKKDFLKRKYSKEKQFEFCKYIVREMGYDFGRGRLDETVHPFTMGISPFDVRITIEFDEHDPTKSIFSAIHEGGHGIYGQGLPKDHMFELVGLSRSLGVHESQSRLYENNIGRSKEFWEHFFPKLKKTFPKQLRRYDVEDFHKIVNEVKRTPIRIYADELTYNLHILVRFEIENEVINKKIEVREIPELWSEKMEEYLGIKPKNDREGALQDVHWSNGMGYFPTYTIGSVLAAQIFEKLRDVMHIEDKIRNGEFQGVKRWLNENIHQKGSLYETGELIKRATGKKLSAKDFLKYVKRKYGEIYGI